MSTDEDDDFCLEQENYGDMPELPNRTDEEDEPIIECPYTLPLL